ncbi:MAG: apolipoprotein N-acyltransferase [Erythrobacter sp.]
MRERFENFVSVISARPRLSALVLGLVSACGYPPLHGWWIALPALAGFVWLLHSVQSWRAAAWLGWLFGWAHLTLANNWIATAFTHQAKMPEFLGWLAVPLLCVYLAIYPAIAAALTHVVMRKRVGERRGFLAFGVAFAGFWIVTEWLRSWIFTGYPWPPLGLLLLGGWESAGIAKLLPWLGTYGLSGLAVFLASLIAFAVRERHFFWASAGALVIALVMMAPLNGEIKLPSEGIRYVVVQPLITQDEINDASKFDEHFARLSGLSAPGQGEPRLVLWPESAIPDYLEDGYPQRYYDRLTAGKDPVFARRRLGAIAGEGSTLLTGVINLNFAEIEGQQRVVTARNSVIGINGDGAINGQYPKAHLVPYGEYLPMEWLLGRFGLDRLTAGTVPYEAGPGPRTLDIGAQGKAGIQVCYEIVFSGQVVDRANRPDYIFNPSNDGWFGWWGPPQHLAQARMRAIEEGLPVLRSTTTGISAVIDANGIVLGTVPSGEAGRIDGYIPAANPQTLFSLIGNALPLGWATLLIGLALILPRLLAQRSERG